MQLDLRIVLSIYNNNVEVCLDEIKSCQKWYFVTKIVLTYCEKKIVLVIEKNF